MKGCGDPVREIAAGDVYQVNLTRRLRAAGRGRGGDGTRHRSARRGARRWQPGAVLRGGATARTRRRRWRARHRSGSWPRRTQVWSSPIKGTAADRRRLPRQGPCRERDDRRPGPQRPRAGCASGVGAGASLLLGGGPPRALPPGVDGRGHAARGVGWAGAIEATFPPGSVTGAPKIAALESIDRLEPDPRGVYCGAIGWVDADASARAISTWRSARSGSSDGELNFGTGGAITWESDPEGEWAETRAQGSEPALGGRRLEQSWRGSRLADECWDSMRAIRHGRRVVWLDGALRNPQAAGCTGPITGSRSATACSRRSSWSATEPFALELHLDRLERSAAGLGLQTPRRGTIEARSRQVATTWAAHRSGTVGRHADHGDRRSRSGRFGSRRRADRR